MERSGALGTIGERSRPRNAIAAVEPQPWGCIVMMEGVARGGALSEKGAAPGGL